MTAQQNDPMLACTAADAANSKESAPLLPIVTTGKTKTLGNQPHALLGIACVAISAVCFSLMTTFIKYATYSMTSMEAVFWRSIIPFALNYACAWYNGLSMHVPPDQHVILFLRCLAGFSSISFAFYAISQMVLADASVIVFTSPVLTFFFGACFLQERIDPPSLVCALLAFSGLVCVVRPGFLFGYDHATAHTDGSWIAIGSALLGAIGQSFVFITVRKLKGLHVLVIIHYFMLFSTIMSLIYIIVVQRVFVIPVDAAQWFAIVGSGVFTFLGQMFLTKGFQLEKAGIASVMRYLDVVCVFVWDSFLLKEKINHWSIIGAVIICVCALVIAIRKMRV